MYTHVPCLKGHIVHCRTSFLGLRDMAAATVADIITRSLHYLVEER